MSENGEHVSRRELSTELRAMRWQLMATILGANALTAYVSPAIAAAAAVSIGGVAVGKLALAALFRS